MKMKQLALVFASLFALSASQVFAAENESEHQSGEHKMKHDADGDGRISYDEYKGSREKGHERQFKKMDANGDGYIDESEKQVQKDKMKSKRDKRKQRREELRDDKANQS